MEKRKSNFELARIIAMFMIVSSHYVYFGIMKSGYENEYVIWNSGNHLMKFLSSSLILGSVGVGFFFMLSGFFLIEEKRVKSLKKIISVTIFYAILSIFAFVFLKMGGGESSY